ncbi:diguanylate cyclase [Pseudoxanthomonas putridarboris]|uniref:diguanylate cyclase n=1 Tax=Pseudoxanthomonas putridarboris TaxID=752605 RepID=A0ABU9J1F9_9GAMM
MPTSPRTPDPLPPGTPARATPPLSRVPRTYPLCPYLAFPRRIYLMRIVAAALAMLMMGTVLHHLQKPWILWVGPALQCLWWPHLAWWRYLHSRDPNRTEKRNLLIDHAFAGLWLPLLDFNLLAMGVGLATLGMASMAGGGLRLAVRGVLVYAACMGLGLGWFGFGWRPAPSLATVLAALPLMWLLPLGVGHTGHEVIERLQRKRRDLERQSWHDGLSGLFNRSHWETVVRGEFARCRRTGQSATLVMVDLDHFKKINDLYGHAAGDQAIRNFAVLLRNHLRVFDVPARYGGEEFGILLPHTTPAEALDVVDRLRARLHAAPLLEQHPITASFGIATLTDDLESHVHWIRVADQMLYTAKYGGRDRIVAREGGQASRPPPGRGALRPLMSSRDPLVLSQLLQGLDVADTPVALFDPSDRLVMANGAFVRLHDLPPGVDTFAEIIRWQHPRRAGPVIDVEPEQWLRRANQFRRKKLRHVFHLETHDGQPLRGVETCFNEGWILMALVADSSSAVAASPSLH